MVRVAWPLALNSHLSLVRHFYGICWRNQSCIVELALGLESGKPSFVSWWCLCGHLAGSIPHRLDQPWRGSCVQARWAQLRGAWLCEQAEPSVPRDLHSSLVEASRLGGNQSSARRHPEGCLQKHTIGVLAQRGGTW